MQPGSSASVRSLHNLRLSAAWLLIAVRYLTETVSVLHTWGVRGVRVESCFQAFLGQKQNNKLLTPLCFGVEGVRFFSLKPLLKSVRWDRVFSLITAVLLAFPLLPQTLIFSLMLVSLATNYLCISFQPRWGLHASVLLLVNSCC